MSKSGPSGVVRGADYGSEAAVCGTGQLAQLISSKQISADTRQALDGPGNCPKQAGADFTDIWIKPLALANICKLFYPIAVKVNPMATAAQKAQRIFRGHGGILRTGDALKAGIHPRTLYAMRESGQIEPLARGVYRLAAMPPLADPDLATVAKRMPNAVVCLISALALHELTTQIPHEVHIAIRRSAGSPVLAHPPLRVYRFSDSAFAVGIDTQRIDNVPVRVYSAEKTLADCFKYRNRIGMEVVLEALQAYRSRRNRDFQAVLRYARICRVERVMRPYLEACL